MNLSLLISRCNVWWRWSGSLGDEGGLRLAVSWSVRPVLGVDRITRLAEHRRRDLLLKRLVELGGGKTGSDALREVCDRSEWEVASANTTQFNRELRAAILRVAGHPRWGRDEIWRASYE